MDIKQYISKLDKITKDINKISEKALADASLATFNIMTKRIFDYGKNVGGGTASYSKKPAVISGYKIKVPSKVNKNSKVYKFQAFKKGTESTKKGYYGRYFPMGYWEYKKFIGRPNDFVNFKLTGGLQMSFNNGFNKVSPKEWEIRLTNNRATQLKIWLDKKYNNVFSISLQEKTFFESNYKENMRLALAK